MSDHIKENATKGYILVKKLDSGLELYKKKNEAGGWSYFGESCGIFGLVWDTCLGSREEFVAIAEDAYGIVLPESFR